MSMREMGGMVVRTSVCSNILLTEEVRDQAPFLSTNYSNIIGEHLVFGFEKMQSVSRNYLSSADLHYFKKRKYRDMIRNLKVR